MTTQPGPENPLRFGILGAARIAPAALVAPAGKLEGVKITRVAARDRARAEAFAAEHGISHVAPDYQALIEADDVDIVYNPLPMSKHAEWTIAALRAGKHVLCEKPFASNAAEAAEMVRVAEETGQILGEAFHYRYHPMFGRILDEVASGRIGTLVRVDGVFNVPIAKPDLRWDYAMSGGSLMDLGCYPVSWVRHVTGEEPVVVSAEAIEDPRAIDAFMHAELHFPSGVTGSVTSAMERERRIELTITGTLGSIVARNPLAPQHGNRLTITSPGGVTSGPVDAGVSYEHMLRAFVDHVVHDNVSGPSSRTPSTASQSDADYPVQGAPFPTRGQDSIANMAAIDAIYRAAGLPLRGQAI